MILVSSFATLALGLAPQQDATGPDAPQQERVVVTERERELLRSRDRARLHPSENPIHVSGLDESGSDFRLKTPALARAEIRPVAVDTEELRQRRIAMLEGGARFSAPTRALPRGGDEAQDDTTESSDPARTERAPKKESGAPWLWLGLITCGAALLAVMKRGR